MQLPESRLWLVRDPSDEPAGARALHALANLDRGVVVVRVTPGPRLLQAIATDVLQALGKDHRHPGVVRHGEENWRRCASWLSGERVQHLIVDRAETLGSKRWMDFIGLAAHCGTSLWMVAHGATLTRTRLLALDDLPLTEITFDEFMTEHAGRWSAAASVDDTDRGASSAGVDSKSAAFPALPRSDFTTFRADCRRLLTADEFGRVEHEMQLAAASTRRWLAEESSPDTPAMKEHLRELIEHCRTSDQALVRLRAAQAVCMLDGLLVTVDVQRLVAATRSASPVIDQQLIGQLREYTSTRRAAIALLACLPRTSPESISRTNISDVSDTQVRIAGTSHALPAIARCVLAAHVHSRLGTGAQPDDALFSDGLYGALGERSTPRAIRHSLNDVARTSGLMLWGEWHNDDHPNRQWLRRRGVTVQVLS